MKPATFSVGDRARKVGGSYQANGTVVAAFKTLLGKQRYVFEFDEFAGMLHIFNHEQLEPLNNESQSEIMKKALDELRKLLGK
ncbi:MAG: hypothetical protein E6Q97_32770 [Desulfurellales bacterium]|nr:MAG: hypothetical protein E6Q97_32770 [Desulfurellales bacterium]